MPTLIVSPRGRAFYYPEYGYIEPGEGDGIVIDALSAGQVVHLDSNAWKAYRQISAGQRPLRLTDTAFHEAGHAITAQALGRDVRLVSLFPSPDGGGLSLGRVEFADYRMSDDLVLEAIRFAAVSLAGRAADRRAGKAHLPGGERDHQEIVSGLKGIFPRKSRLQREILQNSEQVAEGVVGAAWPAVRSLSSLLITRIEVGPDEVADSIASLPPRRQLKLAELIKELGDASA